MKEHRVFYSRCVRTAAFLSLLLLVTLAGVRSKSIASSILANATSGLAITPAGLEPAQWNTIDIGNVGLRGSENLSGEPISVQGSGADIWGASDAFHYVFQPLVGDGRITAHIAAVEDTDPWAKAGVMIRETLSPASRHASIFVTPGNGTVFQSRKKIEGDSSRIPMMNASAPGWVSLTRSGNAISAYVSHDGATWQLATTTTLTMASEIYVGLAVTSRNNTGLNTALFNSVSVTDALGAITSLTMDPSSLVAKAKAKSFGTITISPSAPAGGVTIRLQSNHPAVTVPASVTIPQGATTATFKTLFASSESEIAATITASLGSSTQATNILVLPKRSLVAVNVNPTSVVGGSPSQGTVTLTSAAPSGGAVVTLASSNTSVATVPASVTVASGAGTATFTVTTRSVSTSRNVSISASYAGKTVSAQLTVNPPPPPAVTLSAITLNPTSVVGGSSSQGTATLSAAAPSGGAVVTLTSSNTSAATVPASVTVAAGATTANFPVATNAVSSAATVSISGSYGGQPRSASLTVNPSPPAVTLSSMAVNPTSVVGGSSSQGTATLSAAAPSGGAVVTLTSSNTSAATVPASVTVAAGATSANFTVLTNSVSSAATVSISGSYGGSPKSAQLTVNPPPPPAVTLSAITLNPTSVVGGSSSQGTATLSAAAPSGGAVVTLTSSNTSAATVPASVTVAAGATGASFSVSTSTVQTTTSVSISGSYGANAGASLTVNPGAPAGLSFYVAPNGTASGNGSISQPWDLQTALSQPASLVPGATLYLRAGTYTGKFFSYLTGSAASPITVKSYPGEWAIVDGYKTTGLASPITATSTAITLSNASGIPSFNSVMIDNEAIQLGTKNGSTYTNCQRAQRGTSAASHASGAQATAYGDVIEVQGAYTIYRDFEVKTSDPTRVYTGDVIGTNRLPYRGEGISVYGHHTKLINLVIHDNREGIGFWESATDSEIYGCVIFNNGLVDSVRGHGHGVYTQNNTGTKRILDVISLNNFATGMKGYGQDGHANGLYIEGVASFNNGSPSALPGNPAGYIPEHRFTNLFVGTTTYPTHDVTVVNNYLYQAGGTLVEGGNLGLGYESTGSTNLLVQGNYVMGGHAALSVEGFNDAQVIGNTLYATPHPASSGANDVLASVKTTAPQNFIWNNNTYYDMTTQQDGKTYCYGFNNATNAFGTPRLTYNDPGGPMGKGWKQWTAFDTNSTYAMAKPSGLKVVVRPNQYEAGRAHIIIFNWGLSTSVDVEVSGVLQVGQAYEVRSAQNYLGAPVLSGTYTGGTLRLPMSGLTVATPVGLGFTPQPTSPEFAVFVLIPR